MGRRHRAGAELTRHHTVHAGRQTCPSCAAPLEVRVSAKGYPGQERETVWFDCPACGKEDIACVGMPDTGGADIRVVPLWRRWATDESDLTHGSLPYVVLAGGLAGAGGACLWRARALPGSDFRLAGAMCVVGVVATVCVWIFTRDPVQRWVGYDSARLNLVCMVLAAIVAGTIPLAVLYLP